MHGDAVALEIVQVGRQAHERVDEALAIVAHAGSREDATARCGACVREARSCAQLRSLHHRANHRGIELRPGGGIDAFAAIETVVGDRRGKYRRPLSECSRASKSVRFPGAVEPLAARGDDLASAIVSAGYASRNCRQRRCALRARCSTPRRASGSKCLVFDVRYRRSRRHRRCGMRSPSRARRSRRARAALRSLRRSARCDASGPRRRCARRCGRRSVRARSARRARHRAVRLPEARPIRPLRRVR